MKKNSYLLNDGLLACILIIAILVVGELIKNGPSLAVIGLIFPLIGLLLIYSAVRQFLIWRKFKGTWLEISPNPGKLGDELRCTIYLPPSIKPNSRIRCKLCCKKSETSGSGKSRSTQINEIWAKETSVMIERAPRRDGFNFCTAKFSSEENLSPSSDDGANPKYYWQLELNSELDGVDLEITFDLPMFGS